MKRVVVIIMTRPQICHLENSLQMCCKFGFEEESSNPRLSNWFCRHDRIGHRTQNISKSVVSFLVICCDVFKFTLKTHRLVFGI